MSKDTQEQELGRIVMQVIADKDNKLLTNLDCTINELFSIVINLLGQIEESTGIEYNQLLLDLKETKKDSSKVTSIEYKEEK